MSRQATSDAQNTYNTASNLTGTSAANANNLYGELDSAYTNEAVNPQGFNPAEKADMNTAVQQSEGGALGAATGKAAQYTAANRNSGGFAPALDETARGASRDLSSKALGVNNEDAMLKESQRQEGLSGLGGLEGMENNDVLSSLGLQNQSTNALVNAGNSGWFQNMLGFMNAAGKDAQGAAALMGGGAGGSGASASGGGSF